LNNYFFSVSALTQRRYQRLLSVSALTQRRYQRLLSDNTLNNAELFNALKIRFYTNYYSGAANLYSREFAKAAFLRLEKPLCLPAALYLRKFAKAHSNYLDPSSSF